ncbi:hypothetical protein OH76DRAFT_1406173 [Lentinus brumalis]|uniref:Uncharacterized protein n=1 Tax=Lentinus brumalis TaxID=2498619 RepID=A0A371D437_9APHY|nr:hypothetical protein OH76DRAFT_1406173 [Polyporus brumalis]
MGNSSPSMVSASDRACASRPQPREVLPRLCVLMDEMTVSFNKYRWVRRRRVIHAHSPIVPSGRASRTYIRCDSRRAESLNTAEVKLPTGAYYPLRLLQPFFPANDTNGVSRAQATAELVFSVIPWHTLLGDTLYSVHWSSALLVTHPYDHG